MPAWWLASRVADPLGTRPRSRGAVRPRGHGERRWDIPTAARRPLLSMFYVSRSSRGVGDDTLLRHITPRDLEEEGKRAAATLRSEATGLRHATFRRCYPPLYIERFFKGNDAVFPSGGTNSSARPPKCSARNSSVRPLKSMRLGGRACAEIKRSGE